MNTITIEFCAEDRKRIDELIAIGTLLVGELKSRPAVDMTGNSAAEIPAADPVVETPAPVAEPAPEVKPISLAEFQKAITLVVSKGAEQKKAAKDIINKYAASVSAVPEDKRAEVMAELANI